MIAQPWNYPRTGRRFRPGFSLPRITAARRDAASPLPRQSRSGFSLLEVVISTLIVGVLMVAAMRTLGAAIRSKQYLNDQSQAHLLAASLLEEAVQRQYADASALALFGPELGESGGPRNSFNDVDDYHNWTESPPQDAQGNALANFDGWERQVIVQYVDPANTNSVVLLDQGLKRVTVSVLKNDVELSKLISVRADIDGEFE